MKSALTLILAIWCLTHAVPSFADEEKSQGPTLPSLPKPDPKRPVFAPLPPEPCGLATAGANLYFPAIGFQYSMGEMGTVGALAHTFHVRLQGDEISLLGGVVTFGGYSERAFEGIWVQLGGGAYQASSEYAGGTGTSLALGALATFGYRFRFDQIRLDSPAAQCISTSQP